MATTVKTLNPIEDFITKSASLHLSLCSVADAAFGMGENSGAKRTILLAVSRRPFLLLDDLMAMFAGAESSIQYRTLIPEMKKMGLIRMESQQGKTAIALTESGHEKVKTIVKYESTLASFLPKDLSIADINKAIRCMELMQKTMEHIQSLDQSIPTHIAV